MSKFKGGDEAINRRGRPKGSGRKISQLKTVFNQLKKLSTKAIENIENSIEGKEVDKEQLASSKWAINTLQTYNKAILVEEEGLKDSTPEVGETPGEDDGDKVAAFSLKVVSK